MCIRDRPEVERECSNHKEGEPRVEHSLKEHTCDRDEVLSASPPSPCEDLAGLEPHPEGESCGEEKQGDGAGNALLENVRDFPRILGEGYSQVAGGEVLHVPDV